MATHEKGVETAMLSNEEYFDFILQQLSEIEGINGSGRDGNYSINCNLCSVAIIRNNRLFVPGTKRVHDFMPWAKHEYGPWGCFTLPVDNVENKEFLLELVDVILNGCDYFTCDRTGRLLRKRPHVFCFDIMSSDDPVWREGHGETSYEREYYIGQGNNCLKHVSETEAKRIAEKWGGEFGETHCLYGKDNRGNIVKIDSSNINKDCFYNKNQTRNISLYDLLEITDISELTFKDRWDDPNQECTLLIPIGVDEKGEKVLLDFSEHCSDTKIIGPCGYGKSTFCASIIMLMAALYAPQNVVFAILDTKNTFYTNPIDRLPHTAIYVNNKEKIKKFFNFLKFEYDRRWNCLKEANTPNIYDYNNKCKSEKSYNFMPYLFVIIDEMDSSIYNSGDMSIINSIMRYWNLGIHLIIVSQDDMYLKRLNYPRYFSNTIIFKSLDYINSQEYPIDNLLLKSGECLLLSDWYNKLIKLQFGNCGIYNGKPINELIECICNYHENNHHSTQR